MAFVFHMSFVIFKLLLFREVTLSDDQIITYIIYKFWNFTFHLSVKYAIPSTGEMLFRKSYFFKNYLLPIFVWEYY